jgi:hypothetical protein
LDTLQSKADTFKRNRKEVAVLAATTHAISQVRHIKNELDASPIVRRYPVATGQTLYKGQPVTLTAGQITACASDGALIAGFMEQDAAALTAGTLVDVQVANVGDVYEANLVGTIAAANLGLQCSYAVGTAGLLQVDAGDTGNARVVIVNCDPVAVANSDIYPRVHFKILSAVRQLNP